MTNRIDTHVALWSLCLDIIKDNVDEKIHNTWIEPIIPLKYEKDEFTIQVPSQFFYEYIEEKYADLIHATVARVTGKAVRLKYRVIVDNTNGLDGQTTISGDRPLNHSLAKKNLVGLNKSPNGSISKSVHDWNSNLNARFSFDNFFEGSSNKLPRAVGEAIAQSPDKKLFNPLFIYGSSGVGKTHLCHAIGNKIEELYPQKKVIYISSHLFQVQFTDAARKNVTNDFVNFYQGLDVLIVDDIHELAGKTATQNTYFHIFNHLHLLGKQIIISGDKAPKDIQGIEDRLITRFNWGMTAELQKPDIALRKQILTNKVKSDGLNISDNIIDYIAVNVCDHVRDLEGIITSLMAHSLVYNKEVDLELAERVVHKIIKLEKRQITVDKIQEVVSSYFDVGLEDIHSKSRKREIVQARQVTMFLSKKYTDHSYSHIGNLVGKRDHATVLHACKTIKNTMEVDKTFRSTMKTIEELLKQ